MSNLNLTKEETIKEHRKMWNYIADEIMIADISNIYLFDLEGSYFITHGISECQIPTLKCYCCDYARYSTNSCSACPITWTKNGICDKCGSLCSPYAKLDHLLPLKYEEIGREYLASLAREVANLPEKEDKR